MAMTAEQNANIADFWSKNKGNPQAVMDGMTQFGVGASDLANAIGRNVSEVGNYLTDNGAARGFGGFNKGITDTYYGSAADPSQYELAKVAAAHNPNVVVGGTPYGQTAGQGLQAPPAPVSTPGASANLGMGGAQAQGQYTPNPYLDKMAQGITSQMNDNWTRNQLPSIRSGAMAAGGFGGSRQGVVEANGLNDMNRSLGANLANLYGSDYNNAMGRNLQQQSINNSYDLGLRSSDLGFSNLDANIAQNNFGNQMQAANFGMGVYSTLNNQTQNGINAGTNIQNTPLDYQKYFTNSANGVGSGYGTSNTSQTNQGNPWLGALGGAQIGNQIQKNWG